MPSLGPDGTVRPLFFPLALFGGMIFGFGLGFSHMARPEVVLDFLQFTGLGLVFVMFGAAMVTGLAFSPSHDWTSAPSSRAMSTVVA